MFADANSTQKTEVYNCGIGGWVSADIMINFLLNILPTNPDYVVLYHGICDLHLYLMSDFARDYSHGRYNFGEVIPRIKRAYYWPKIPGWTSYEYWKDKNFGTGNVRNDVLKRTKKERPDLSRLYRDLKVEKDILRNILVVCQYHGIKCILASYAFYHYRDDDMTKKMGEGVSIENRHIRALADEFNLPFVDIDGLVPKEDKYFLDWVHLTPAGMKIMAEKLAEEIFQIEAEKSS